MGEEEAGHHGSEEVAVGVVKAGAGEEEEVAQ